MARRRTASAPSGRHRSARPAILPPQVSANTPSSPSGSRNGGDPSIRRTWWLLAGVFFVLALTAGIRLVTEKQPVDWLIAGLVVLAAIAAIAHRNAVAGLEYRGRGEAESFARIVRSLSRSVSAEAIVNAILDDLVDATAADHVVFIRRRRDGAALEATLVTRRAGVPSTSTILPLSLLDPSGAGGPKAPVAHSSGGVAARRGTEGPARCTAGGRSATGRRRRMPRAARRRDGRSPFRPSRDAPPTRAAAGRSPDASPRKPWRSFETSGFRRPTSSESAAEPRPRRCWRAATRRSSSSALRTACARRSGCRTPSPRRFARPSWGSSARSCCRAGTEMRGRRARVGSSVAPPARPRPRLIAPIPYRAAETSASTDPLTGLPNRRYFDEFSSLLTSRRRSGDALAVLMIDIDKFKGLNDTYGHPVGDEVLKSVAGAITAAVRDQDVPARIGGEEFAVLLRNPGPTVALEVGERVRQAVRELDLGDMGVPGRQRVRRRRQRHRSRRADPCPGRSRRSRPAASQTRGPGPRRRRLIRGHDPRARGLPRNLLAISTPTVASAPRSVAVGPRLTASTFRNSRRAGSRASVGPISRPNRPWVSVWPVGGAHRARRYHRRR